MNSSVTSRYDIFLSYSRRDNVPGEAGAPTGWVTAIRDHILADHHRLDTSPLRIFFDTEEIRDMDDWRHRILGALRSSRILLVCLSPNYFASEYCRWEWDEYLQRQVRQLMGSESIAGVYFVEVPGSDDQSTARWLEEILRQNFTDIRPWFPEGAEALQREEVQRRMAVLGQSVWERLQRARRAEAALGNLRRPSVHFVGRREDLRKLHEVSATGADGAVPVVHGLGGLGKSELVVAYAHAFADCYPAGLWSLRAEGKSSLLGLIGELAWERQLGFPPSEAEKNDAELLGRGVLARLEQLAVAAREKDPDRGAAALLMLDNVSEAALLSATQLSSLPRGDWLRVVATTRLGPDQLRAHKQQLVLLPIDPLDEDSAVALVREHRSGADAAEHDGGHVAFASSEDETALREIVRDLGCFTLAVEQVAVFLGLHPELLPAAFLRSLRTKGLAAADSLVDRDPNVSAQMLTQSKQLSVILDATLSRLDKPSVSALRLAALLPPDCVPWPWLRALTTLQHPSVGDRDDFGADPWVEIRRRLVGLRLLSNGDEAETAKMHRLVAAHLGEEGGDGVSPLVEDWMAKRAVALSDAPDSAEAWELRVLPLAMRGLLGRARPSQALACAAVVVSGRLEGHLGLGSVWELLSAAVPILERAALSEDSNANARVLQTGCLVAAGVALQQGDMEKSMKLFQISREAAGKSLAAGPLDEDRHRLLLASLCGLGKVSTRLGHYAEALQLFLEEKAVAEHMTVLGPSPQLQVSLGIAMTHVGRAAMELGRFPDAHRELTGAKAVLEAALLEEPRNQEWTSLLRDVLSALGVVCRRLGDPVEAQASEERARNLLLAMTDNDATNFEARVALSWETLESARVARDRGDLDDAEQRCHDSMAIADDLLKVDPTNRRYRRRKMDALGMLASVTARGGDSERALELYREAARIAEQEAMQRLPDKTWEYDFADLLNCMADLLLADSYADEALRCFSKSLEISTLLVETNPENVVWLEQLVRARKGLAAFEMDFGETERAVVQLEAAQSVLETMIQLDPGTSEWVANCSATLDKLASLTRFHGRLDAACGLLSRSIELQRRLVEGDPDNGDLRDGLARSWIDLGDLQMSLRNLERAREAFEDGVATLECAVKEESEVALWQLDLALILSRLVPIHREKGEREEAQAREERSRRIVEFWSRRRDALSDFEAECLEEVRLSLGE